MNLIVNFVIGSVDENKLMEKIGFKHFDGIEFTIQDDAPMTKRMYWYHLKQDAIKKAAYILQDMPYHILLAVHTRHQFRSFVPISLI